MLALAVILIVVVSVSATMAYFTDNEKAVNTFTVGQVGIELTETGAAAGTDGTLTKAYENILPGHTYAKDPTVKVDANSSDCYVFVEIINNLSAVELKQSNDEDKTIADQLAANKWIALEGAANVYYYNGIAEANASLPVFASFSVDGSMTNEDMAAVNNKTIEVTAYAVQAPGFESAAEAWAATFGA